MIIINQHLVISIFARSVSTMMILVTMLFGMMMLVLVMPVVMMFYMHLSFNPTDIMDGEVASLAMTVLIKLVLALCHVLMHLLVHTWMSLVINDWCSTAVCIVNMA